MNVGERFMRWLGIVSPPEAPIVPPEVEQRFHEANRQNQEAVIQSTLSNRRLRAQITPERSAIDDLLRRLHEQERGP